MQSDVSSEERGSRRYDRHICQEGSVTPETEMSMIGPRPPEAEGGKGQILLWSS